LNATRFGTSLATVLTSFTRQKMRVEEAMSIQKKSLISTLKTAKKANLAKETKGQKIGSMRVLDGKALSQMKSSLKTLKAVD